MLQITTPFLSGIIYEVRESGACFYNSKILFLSPPYISIECFSDNLFCLAVTAHTPTFLPLKKTIYQCALLG